jgi:hypothetical protein
MISALPSVCFVNGNVYANARGGVSRAADAEDAILTYNSAKPMNMNGSTKLTAAIEPTAGTHHGNRI